MKKVLKIITKILLIITIILLALIIIKNLYIIIRILFFGMTVGSNQYPDSIWLGEVFLKGIEGIKKYYSRLGELILYTEIPITIISIIYQIIYFKTIKKSK